MTTNIDVRPHSHDVLVETWDRTWDPDTSSLGEFKKTHEQLVEVGKGETFYSTTTREIRSVDLERDDPRRTALKKSPE